MKWDAEKYDRVNIQQFESGMELARLAELRKDDIILEPRLWNGQDNG